MALTCLTAEERTLAEDCERYLGPLRDDHNKHQHPCPSKEQSLYILKSSFPSLSFAESFLNICPKRLPLSGEDSTSNLDLFATKTDSLTEELEERLAELVRRKKILTGENDGTDEHPRKRQRLS